MSELSEHDKAVLNCIFNPNLPLDQAYEEDLTSELQDIEENTTEILKSKEVEIEAIKKAETSDINEAVKMITLAIKIAPHRASPYNNRAQMYQLIGDMKEAYNDLTKAIQLGNNKQRKTTCQALCQRGLIYRKWNKIELARDDFNSAAKMGSNFAKNQLIELNPYAALCNQMLKRAFENLQ